MHEWRGKLERVMVLDKDFAWNEELWQPPRAKAITGASWNRHRFFGLQSAKDQGSKRCQRPSGPFSIRRLSSGFGIAGCNTVPALLLPTHVSRALGSGDDHQSRQGKELRSRVPSPSDKGFALRGQPQSKYNDTPEVLSSSCGEGPGDHHQHVRIRNELWTEDCLPNLVDITRR